MAHLLRGLLVRRGGGQQFPVHWSRKLKSELELDGVSAALEMSRRGGHLWIFCERPLLAEQCRVYIYNVALRLGVPIKGAAGLRDGIEIFHRQDRLALSGNFMPAREAMSRVALDWELGRLFWSTVLRLRFWRVGLAATLRA